MQTYNDTCTSDLALTQHLNIEQAVIHTHCSCSYSNKVVWPGVFYLLAQFRSLRLDIEVLFDSERDFVTQIVTISDSQNEMEPLQISV